MNFPFSLKTVLLALAMAPSTWGAVTYYAVDHYRGRADSPFLQGLQDGTMYLENFQSINVDRPPYNYLTTPHAQGWNGLVTGAPSHGVQEDFATGELGRTWDSSAGSPDTTQLPRGIHFDFTPDEQGRLPEYVGAALLGRGLSLNSPAFNLILVYDRDGMEVTNGEWQIPRPDYNLPYLEEDLFLHFEGIHVSGGISRIHFRDFLEVDHLTYGYSIPEPTAALLATAAGLLCLRRKRRIFP